MKAVVQRVGQASVSVAGEVVGRIGHGLLVLLAVERGDRAEELRRMVAKVAGLRIFADAAGKMNLSVGEVGGGVLAISQFTLAGEVRKGFRPSFGRAESPERAERLYQAFCRQLAEAGLPVAQGRFAADMQVALVNDGPVTIWLDFPPPEAEAAAG